MVTLRRPGFRLGVASYLGIRFRYGNPFICLCDPTNARVFTQDQNYPEEMAADRRFNWYQCLDTP